MAGTAALLESRGYDTLAVRREVTSVRTEMARPYLEDEAFRTALEARIPLGRVAEPGDIVGPVTFFVSPAAGFVWALWPAAALFREHGDDF